jgi:hypothetical protein
VTPNVTYKGGKILEVWLVSMTNQDLHIDFVDSPRLGINPPRWVGKHVVVRDLFGDERREYQVTGPCPWLQFELQEDSWGPLLGIGYPLDEERWLLENGVAPGQPFKVRIEQPHYYKSWTDCGYEYDCDYGDWDIVERASWDRDRVMLAWYQRTMILFKRKL